MKYEKFIINNYRAIGGPLEIDVRKDSLMPIVGVNESGKTTILQAIFAFDYFNDTANDGRHLKDTANLYKTSSESPTIKSRISITKIELSEAIDAISAKPKTGNALKDVSADLLMLARNISVAALPESFNSLTLVRHLDTGNYSIEGDLVMDTGIHNELARAIIQYLPYILYFDDFRDSVEDRIEISKDAKVSSSWLEIVEQLFVQTDAQFSVYKLEGLEVRNRKSVLAKVNKHLNETLTKEWQRFRLDEVDALKISIEYEEEFIEQGKPTALASLTVPAAPPATQRIKRSFLKFEIIETDANGDAHYFYVRDRSKGFYWFFNFVMKLEFNPKVLDTPADTIYLLDEPGSYLHASAQSKLCAKLRQLSVRNTVLYCTHSHYLLDPEIIPVNTIKVADKDGLGKISLISIFEHKGNILDRRSAFQPVLDALQIKPFLLDLTHSNVVITEGIHDYYALELFKGLRSINVLPSVGAASIKYYVSLMIAWRVTFKAAWDNDDAGRKGYEDAKAYFGEEIEKRHFRLLPLPSGRTRNRILQDLFDGADIQIIKAKLGLPSNSAFGKMITALFYSPDKSSILNQLSWKTQSNFDHLFVHLGI